MVHRTGQLMKFLILAVPILLNTLAGMFLKRAAQETNGHELLASVSAMASSWWLWLSIGCFATAFGFYAYSLVLLPLSIAYPVITAGSIVFVSAGSVLWMNERFSLSIGLGVLFICVGIALLSYSALDLK